MNQSKKGLYAGLILLLGATLGCVQIASLQPTATPQPTKSAPPITVPLPGWEKFEARGVELWLPESFEGGDLSADIGVIAERLRSFGPEFEQMAQMIEQNPSMYVIWAFDSEMGESGFLTNMNVTTETVLSSIPIDTYLDAVVQQLPPQFQVAERDIVSLGDYEAGRMVVAFEISGITGKELLYVIKTGNTIWAITYATSTVEYDQRLPVFEQSARTFKIQP